jgi:hypothetical protein
LRRVWSGGTGHGRRFQSLKGSCRKPITESLNITRYAGQAVGLWIQATSQAAAGTVLSLDNFVLSGG